MLIYFSRKSWFFTKTVPFCPSLGQVGTNFLLKTKDLALVPLVPLSHKKSETSGRWSEI